MKDEFQQEKELMEQLNAYEVRIPKQKIAIKQTSWQRFIRYLASPTRDPLEKVTESARGVNLSRTVPLACGLFITIVQIVIIMNS